MAEWKKAFNRVASLLPPLNFLTLHHAYFIVMGLIWSLIFWASATPFQSVDFTNSLFLCVSAMTGAGLNTAILFGLIILGHPVLVSSTVLFIRKRAFETRFHSIVLASTRRSRRRSMRRRSFHSIISNSASALSNTTTAVSNNTTAVPNDTTVAPDETTVAPDDTTVSPNDTTAVDVNQIGSRSGTTGASIEPLSVRNESGPESSTVDNNLRPRRNFDETNTIRWADNDPGAQLPSAPRMRPRVFSMSGVGARPDARIPKDAEPVFIEDDERASGPKETMGQSLQKYLGFNGFVSRNSQFHGLKLHDREKLGGVEYKAICLLSIVVPVYFLTFNILGFIGIGAWFSVYKPNVARENGLNPFWTGSFFAISAFGNNGMSLLDMNTIPLQTSAYPLLSMGLLILAGNTLYPCSLRFCIWTMRRILPRTKWCDEWKIVLDFILDHPRRVYTYLFPERHTWYLLATVVLLNGVDWAGFEVLSIGNSAVESLGSYRVLDGLFQAFAVRAGGLYIVNISSLHQGLLVLYVLMMYVSAYPVLVTIRNTNVYEERSLGIYATDNLAEDQRNQVLEGSFFGALRTLISMSHKKQQHDPVRGRAPSILDDNNTSRSYFVRQQLRSQLSHDIWWICLAIFFITIAEGPHYSRDPITYSTFNIIFEVVSGYSCVGISVGLPNENYSFCGAWYKISKLILIAVMLRGRHRGLPVSIDKSVMLPDDSLAWAEEEDAALRLERSQSRSVVRNRSRSVVRGTNYERKPSLDVV